MPENRITLFLSRGPGLRGWMARHEGPAADKVRELFDTDTLPTPFLDTTPASYVVAVLRLLNPGAEVKVGEPCTDCERLAENYDEDPLCHNCWKAREANRVEAEAENLERWAGRDV